MHYIANPERKTIEQLTPDELFNVPRCIFWTGSLWRIHGVGDYRPDELDFGIRYV